MHAATGSYVFVLPLFPAIVAVALYAGARAAAFSMVVTAFALPSFWWPAAPSLPPESARDAYALLGYLLTSALLVALAVRSREAQERMGAAERMFSQALGSSSGGFVIARPVYADGRLDDFIVTYANRAAAAMIRRPPEGLLNVPLAQVLPGRWRETPLFAAMVRVLEGGAPAELVVNSIEDAPPRRYLNRISRYSDGLAIWFEDVTAQESAQAQLAELNARLEERIAALRRTEKALQEADQRKDEFLATLAHELRNPLAPIRYATRLLKTETSPVRVQAARDLIERQSGQMARLLDDLMDLSRITRNVIELKRERVDLRRVLQDCVTANEPIATAAGHRLSVLLPATPLWVDGDPTRLYQIVANLLSNAIKYTDAGGRVELHAEREDGCVRVAVRDTGIGIEPARLAEVFRLFAQVHVSASRPRSGLGIGLAVVKRLVELHGGAIDVRSDGPGLGAEFVVRLPLAATRPESIGSAVPAEPLAATGSARVLVVDDNVDAAETLATLLKLEGYQVRAAHDGEQAIQVAEALCPEIVVLDLGLPRIGGDEVARWIRRQPWGARARLVAVTGWGQQCDRERTRASGFDAHLVKPVDPDVLLRELRRGDGVHHARAAS